MSVLDAIRRAFRGGVSLQAATPMAPTPGPTYPGAGGGRRVTGFWAPNVGVNRAIVGALPTLRARSHALVRQDPYVWRALRSYVANLIGTGITPQSQIVDEATRRAVSETWTDWTDEADADGRTDFYGLQALIALTVMLGGEALVRLRPRRLDDGLVVPLQLQVLEGDHLPLDKTETLPNGNMIRCGIEFGPIGNRVAYWLTREHPSDGIGASWRATELVRVPADQVLHIYELIRPGQLRGEPRLARVLMTAFHLDQFEDATLEKAKLAAAITGWIRAQGGDGPLVNPNPVPDATTGTVEQAIEPGTLSKLEDNQEIQFAPAAEIGDYEAFTKHGIRKLASGAGSTYEHTSGDYEGVTYSSLREQKNQLERELKQVLYAMLCPQFCRPVRLAWFAQAMLANALPIAPSAYVATPRAFTRTTWIAPGLAYADPLKEVTAKKEAIRGGLTSVSAVIRETGEDPEKVFAEIAADNERARMLGLVLDTNPAHKIAAAATTMTPDPTAMPVEDEPPSRQRRVA